MVTKTKIGIAALIIASFIIGGFALNAYQAGAFGFFRGGFGRMGDKDMPEITEEMKAKLEERKAEMETNMEEWKNMSQEEREAKMEEMKANRPEFDKQARHGFMPGAFGFMGMKGVNPDEVNYEVVNIDNGVQITIASDNPDIVQKLQDFATRINNLGK